MLLHGLCKYSRAQWCRLPMQGGEVTLAGAQKLRVALAVNKVLGVTVGYTHQTQPVLIVPFGLLSVPSPGLVSSY